MQENLANPASRGLTRFALLAQAVAGRRVEVVGRAQERAYTDGNAIFLPELPETLLQGAVVLQAALISAGSLEPWAMAKIARRRSLRLRYLSLEAARAAASLDLLIPARVLALLADVYNGPVPTSPQESLEWAAAPARGVPEAPAWLGTIRPLKVLLAAPSRLQGPQPEPGQAGGWVQEALRELDDEEESERSGVIGRFAGPIVDPVASAVEKFFGMGRVADAAGGGGAKTQVARGAMAPDDRLAQPHGGPRPELGGIPAGRHYPEWDCVRGAYRRDWCVVREVDPRTPKEEPAPISTSDARLRRQLARLGLTPERHRRQAEGDALDLTALIELVVDRVSGQPGDPRVYETRRRTAHDLGVLILLDSTGSTGQSAEGARVFDEERLLAARLTAALDELGVRVATFGFHSQGPKAIRFLRVKDFEDRYDLAAQRRLGALAPGGFTRLGAGIRHGAHVLSSRAGTSMMLFVLVSDGLPYENDYERLYAEEDTRRALRETVELGIGCACVSVRASTDEEVLRRVWGDVPHRRLRVATELERHVHPLFREAMRAAVARRRPVTPGAAPRSRSAVAPTRRQIARRES